MHLMSASWFVSELSCQRVGLSASWFVSEMSVSLRFRYLDFSFLCTFVPVSEKSTDGTFVPVELSFPGTFVAAIVRYSSGANVPRTLALWNFCSLKLSLPYLQNWVKSLQQSVRRRILAMVVGLRAHVETFSLETTQYIVDEVVDLLGYVRL